MKKGDRIHFEEESRPYVIRSIGERYVVCTKPFNLRHTVLYTVVDMKENVRGTEDLVFGLGAETDKQCEEMLYRLEHDVTEISHRNRIPLLIKYVYLNP